MVAWLDALGLWQGSPSRGRGCVEEEVFMASGKETEGVASVLWVLIGTYRTGFR